MNYYLLLEEEPEPLLPPSKQFCYVLFFLQQGLLIWFAQNVKDKMGFNTSFSSDWKHYQETFLSVVSETIYDGRLNFFSEKICKPLINLHPFILMSTPYSLKFLKKFGFKTFHPFINEQYDKEENDLKRMQMIFDELDKFRNKSDKELKDWWEEILPVLEHNQKIFINMGNKKTKKIKLLERLYD